MKRVIMSAVVMLFLAGGVSAQSSGSSGASGNTMSTSGTGANAKKTKKGKKTTGIDRANINERRMYKGKNGQTATPTGHEATGNSGGYSSLKKDTTAAKRQEE